MYSNISVHLRWMVVDADQTANVIIYYIIDYFKLLLLSLFKSEMIGKLGR